MASSRDSANERAPVVLLGMSATGLGALRLLGHAGVTCYGVDDHDRAPAYWSRYSKKNIQVSPNASDDDIAVTLDSFAATLAQTAVLLPTSDRFVQFVSHRRSQLESRYRILLPDSELIDDLLNKERFAERARLCQANLPRTAMLRGLTDLPSVANDMGLPVIVKPVCKEDRESSGVPKVILLEREEQISAACKLYVACGDVPFLAQEYIPGGDLQQISVAVCLDRQSKVIATFTARKRRQGNLGAGVGTYVESFQDAEAEEIATSLLRQLGYQGIAEVEFKRHALNQRLYLIEINPRVWTQVTLPGACGLNYPYLFYCLATGLPLPESRITGRWTAWQSLWDDFYNTFRRGGYRSAGLVSTVQWLKQTAQARVGPFFDLRDPWPGFAQFFDVARQVFGRSS